MIISLCLLSGGDFILFDLHRLGPLQKVFSFFAALNFISARSRILHRATCHAFLPGLFVLYRPEETHTGINKCHTKYK